MSGEDSSVNEFEQPEGSYWVSTRNYWAKEDTSNQRVATYVFKSASWKDVLRNREAEDWLKTG